jgi:hypothetical protein
MPLLRLCLVGGEERQKDTKKKIECEQSGIPTHHTGAETL